MTMQKKIRHVLSEKLCNEGIKIYIVLYRKRNINRVRLGKVRVRVRVRVRVGV